MRTTARTKEERRAIYTIKCGKPPYAIQTLPTICEYAERTNSVLHILTETDLALSADCRWANMLIFEIWHRFARSEETHMLYLDLDIEVSRTAPDIFDLYPEGVWMAKDPKGRGLRTHKHAMPYDVYLEKKLELSLDDYPEYDTYFNSGVMLMSKPEGLSLSSIAKPPYIHSMPYLKDQHQVNAFLMQGGIRVNRLPQEWNQHPEGAGEKHFKHYLTKKAKRTINGIAKEVPFNIFDSVK